MTNRRAGIALWVRRLGTLDRIQRRANRPVADGMKM
jgi:hypothetical protein